MMVSFKKWIGMSKGWWNTLTTDFSKAAPPYGSGIENKHSQAPLPQEVETVIVGGGLLGLSLKKCTAMALNMKYWNSLTPSLFRTAS